MKRFVSIIVVFMLLFSLSACSDTTVKGSVVRVSTYGNAELDIMPQKLMENIIVGDTVLVTIGDFSEEMPFVDILIAEDGKLQLFFDKEDHNINICIYKEKAPFKVLFNFIILPCSSFESWHSSSNMYLYLD